MKKRLLIIFVIGLSVHCTLFGQDVEQFVKDKTWKQNPVKINGGLNARQVYHATDNPAGARQPFLFNVSGNINVSVYKWSFPFSFNYTNQVLNYNRPRTQPFNQFGMSPSYKWVTGHFGWRSMTFSPYTLNGHLFLGAGVELNPNENWEVQAMYGRLLKEIAFEGNNTPAYRRWGTGFKVTKKYQGGKISIISFNGWDDVTSLTEKPDSIILPESNMVFGAIWEQSIFKNLSLTVEGARSAFTRDVRSQEVQQFGDNPIDRLFFTSTKASTDFYGAVKGSLNYKLKWATIGGNYERIDPGYRTLGAYYFNSDLRNLTLNFGTQLFKKKMNIAANIGQQINNLDGGKASETSRLVGSLNLSGSIGKKLNLSGSYSNFTSFTVIQPVDQQIQQLTQINYDSLNFTQLSNSLSGNGTYTLAANKKRSHTLSSNVTFQTVSSKNGEGDFVGGTEVYNGNLNYTYNFVPWKLGVQAGVNTNFTIAPEAENKMFGATVGAGKPLIKEKVKANFSMNYNKTMRSGEERSGHVIVTRMGFSTTLREKHNIGLSANYISRQQTSGNTNDFTGSINYSYSFSLLDKKDKEKKDQTKG